MIGRLVKLYCLGYNTGALVWYLIRKSLSKIGWCFLNFCSVLGNILEVLTQFSLEWVPSADQRQVISVPATTTKTQPETVPEWGTARPRITTTTTALPWETFRSEQETRGVRDCDCIHGPRKRSSGERRVRHQI